MRPRCGLGKKRDIDPGTPPPWTQSDAGSAVAAGIMPADLQSVYESDITRAEFCALAVTLIGRQTGKPIHVMSPGFTGSVDMNVQKLASFGIVNGMGDGTFASAGGAVRRGADEIRERGILCFGKTSGRSYWP